MSAPGTRDDAAAVVTEAVATEAVATEAALPMAAYERARAIGRAGGSTGELTGARLAAQGVSWDDVAYAAVLTRAQHEANVAAYEALDPTEREYRAGREHWVALQAARAAEEPGSWDRTREALGLRPEQSPTRLQLAARETERMRELEAQYDRAHGRTPPRHERPYTLADAEADEGAEAAWWAIDGMDEQHRELGEPSTAERVATFEQVHGIWNAQTQGFEVPDAALTDGELGAATLTRDDLDRIRATTRAEAIARRLPDLSVHEVLDLASHAQNTRHVTAPGELDDVAARADLRALATEADRRAAGQPEHSSAALLAEYVDRARLDLDPAVDHERWLIAGALHRALDDETRIAEQAAAWELLPDPGDDAGWAALDDADPAIAAALEAAADPVATEAAAARAMQLEHGAGSEEAAAAWEDYDRTREQLHDYPPHEAGRPSAGHDDLDPPAPAPAALPVPDRAEQAELAARAGDPWGHEERVAAEHPAGNRALHGWTPEMLAALRSLPPARPGLRELAFPDEPEDEAEAEPTDEHEEPEA